MVGEAAFNKLIVFDEAHKYMGGTLIGQVVEVIREMRHKGVSVVIASQDPVNVPPAVIELSSAVVMHRFNSPGPVETHSKVACSTWRSDVFHDVESDLPEEGASVGEPCNRSDLHATSPEGSDVAKGYQARWFDAHGPISLGAMITLS